jgi:hypothetical protein
MRLIAPVVLLAFLSDFTFADHLPPELIATGKPETLLCDIDVNHTTLADLKNRVAKPLSFKNYPETEETAEMIWEQDGSRIHVTVNADNIAYAVEVSGKASPIAKTGRGLAIGQSSADIKRIYGPRFLQRGNDITIQWKEGSELRVRLTSGRISSLELIASVE